MKTKLTANEDQLMDQLRQRGRRTIDVRLDRLWLNKITDHPSFLLHQLHRKGLAHPLQRGRHEVHLDRVPSSTPRVESFEVLASAVLARLEMNYYLSWHSALWHHHLIDQQSAKAYVAVDGRKRPARVGRLEVMFITLRPHHFFGWTTTRSGGWPVNVAGVEKAIVDSLFRPQFALGLPQIAMALQRAWAERRINPDLLAATAIRFGNKLLCRRLGYLMEGLAIPGWEALLAELGWSGPTVLELGFPPPERAVVSTRWGVFENPHLLALARSPK